MTGDFLSQSCSQLFKIKISVNKIDQYSDNGEHYLLTKYSSLYMIKILTHRPGASFSKVPKSFSKISDLLSTELFYVPNKNRGSLQTESFRRMRLSVFKC